MERKINISNLPEGGGIDKAAILGLIERHYDKLNGRLNGELIMDVHFKAYHKMGGKEEIETKVKATMAGFSFHADAKEWSAEKSVKRALEDIGREAARALDKKKE